MTLFNTKILAAALGLSIAALSAAGASAQSFQGGYIQTLEVSSNRGASQMDQFFSENTGASSRTRVCLVNLGSVPRAFTHAVTGINPLNAAPGAQSCANFSSDARVAYGMVDGVEPATPSRAMVMSLGAFAGGTVTFVWR